MDIGTKIGTLRRNSKLTQTELAHKLKISQTTMSEIESGETKKIDVLLLDQVCKVFEVDFDYFLKDDKVNFNFDKVEKNKGGNIGCKIDVVNNNNFPEGILENMLKRIESLEEKLK